MKTGVGFKELKEGVVKFNCQREREKAIGK
jgi:hypothetical protein